MEIQELTTNLTTPWITVLREHACEPHDGPSAVDRGDRKARWLRQAAAAFRIRAELLCQRAHRFHPERNALGSSALAAFVSH